MSKVSKRLMVLLLCMTVALALACMVARASWSSRMPDETSVSGVAAAAV